LEFAESEAPIEAPFGKNCKHDFSHKSALRYRFSFERRESRFPRISPKDPAMGRTGGLRRSSQSWKRLLVWDECWTAWFSRSIGITSLTNC